MVVVDLACVEPWWDGGLAVEALEFPFDADAVDAVFGGEFGGGQAEAFGLAHAGAECEAEDKRPHVSFVGVGEQAGWFCVFHGIDCLCWLACGEDHGGGRFDSWWIGHEHWVRGDEPVACGGVQDLFEPRPVVEYGFAGSADTQVDHGVFDSVWCDCVEPHAADGAGERLAFGSVAFEYAWFDTGGDDVEPVVHVCAQLWGLV